MLTHILKDDSRSNSVSFSLQYFYCVVNLIDNPSQRKDLSTYAHIENIVIESFQTPFEEIKSAASYALGNIVVIVRQSVDKAKFQESSVEKILNLLFNHCESEEERVCNVRTTSPSAFTRATVVIAVKYSIVVIMSMQHVRRAAVLAISTLAHNKPNLIKGLLPDLLPLLYDQTIVKVT
ncbi:Cullin-associated NEDD8-dissociated protein 1 [Glycine max]|nr:Cullin-associated NEDD8-dissociated protein 1 [Glycine max]